MERRQEELEFITRKHLNDQVSDQLYEPFRQVAYGIYPGQLVKDGRVNELISHIRQGRIRSDVDSLRISKQTINPFEKFIIIAESKRQYSPISLKVLTTLLQTSKTEKIVYEYGNSSQNRQRNQRARFKSVNIQRKSQNQYKLGNKFKQLKQLKVKNPKYNILSVVDGPVNSLIKGNIFNCGDCSNQIIARERQFTYQFTD